MPAVQIDVSRQQVDRRCRRCCSVHVEPSRTTSFPVVIVQIELDGDAVGDGGTGLAYGRQSITESAARGAEGVGAIRLQHESEPVRIRSWRVSGSQLEIKLGVERG